MDAQTIQDYTLRITRANRTELIVILYEIALDNLLEAKEHLHQGNEVEYKKRLQHVCKCVNELIVSLDFSYQISYELMRLYRYVNECILTALTVKDITFLDQATRTLEGLKIAFEQVAAKDQTGPVMQNTEKVYAGLTYSKNTLNEALLHTSINRGFRA